MPMPNTWSRAAGLRAIELTSEPKILPMPTPAPATPIAASPAPIILAEVGSMSCVPLVVRRWMRTGSVQVNRVAQVETGQDREDIGLQRRDDDLKGVEGDVDRDREETKDAERDREPREHRHHRVPGHHVREQPDAEA